MKYLFIFILVLLLAAREFFYFENRHVYKNNDTFKLTYSITHEPKKNTYYQYFFVDSIMVTTPLYPTYHYGDTLIVDGVVKEKQTKKGSLLVVQNPKIEKIEKSNMATLLSKWVRKRVEVSVIKTLPGKEAGLLLGIILGVRDKIDSDYYQTLKMAGVLHVIAASGQNVSIVAAMLLLIFLRLVKRKLALLFTSLGVLAYAFLAGFDPPIVRASVMALLAFAALFTGRQASSLYILFLTGWGMLLYQPEKIGDVSFQLSFLSTFGIVSIKPLFDKVFVWKYLSLLRDDITTTLSAQIATFPVMLASFGAYSLLSFPINIMLLWTIPLIMIFGGIGALLSLFSSLLAYPFIILCYPFLYYFTFVVIRLGRFNAQLSVENLPFLVLAGYYLMLFGIVILFSGKKFAKK